MSVFITVDVILLSTPAYRNNPVGNISGTHILIDINIYYRYIHNLYTHEMHDGWNGIEINHALIYVRYVLDNRSFLPFVNESSMSLPPLSPVRVAGVAKNNHHIIIVSSTTNKN